MEAERIFVVDRLKGREFRALKPRYLSSREEVRQALVPSNGSGSLWIVRRPEALAWISAGLSVTAPEGRRGRLLFVDAEADMARILPMAAGFERTVARPLVTLPDEQLADRLALPDRQDHCIGGAVDLEAGTLTLVRGDFRTMIVPLEDFKDPPVGAPPDFSKFKVIDWGDALAFGEYEAAFDAVLYERDADFRRRLNAKRRAEDLTFGASLRRLRLQRELQQSEIPGLREKTVARIERGEVKKPHARTLALLAKALQVTVGELGSF